MKSIAIIGAGAAGLCAARHFVKHPKFHPVVYEIAEGVGGTWIYTKSKDDNCVHSSMYENLTTNLPKQVMEFPDFPFENNIPTFMHHSKVLTYLKKYAVEFGLHKHIKFKHKVADIRPVEITNKTADTFDDVQWKVTVENRDSRKMFSKVYDFVLVCNGHYSDPFMPNIVGIEYFKGDITHSHVYNNALSFVNKNVLIMGAGASGLDIALEIAEVAKNVYISHKHTALLSKLPENLTEVPTVKDFKRDGTTVSFINGHEARDITSVIYCTGYQYNFPFLDHTCGISINRNRVMPLFKHIVNIRHPSMLFIGIPAQIPPFRVLNMQAQYALAVLSGRTVLPPKFDMIKDSEKEFQERLNSGLPHTAAHLMTGRVMGYIDGLTDAANIPNIPDSIKDLYLFVLDHRAKNLRHYKTDNYVLNHFGKYVIER